MTDYEPLEVFSDIYYDKAKEMFPNMTYHEILLYLKIRFDSLSYDKKEKYNISKDDHGKQNYLMLHPFSNENDWYKMSKNEREMYYPSYNDLDLPFTFEETQANIKRKRIQ